MLAADGEAERRTHDVIAQDPALPARALHRPLAAGKDQCVDCWRAAARHPVADVDAMGERQQVGGRSGQRQGYAGQTGQVAATR